MAHVTFIQTEWFEQLGILSLVAAAKKKGHTVSLLLGHRPKKLAGRVLELKSDVVAFSSTTGAHRAALSIAREIRSDYDGIILLGGPHSTFFPEVINDPVLDAIFRGEGDLAFPEMLSRLDREDDWKTLPGFWVKDNGLIIQNPSADLITDLDSLPFPDRESLMEADPWFRKLSMRSVVSGRGCPYSCTYCFNAAMRELVKGKGPYVRTRSVENLIAELKILKEMGARTINFQDDSFGLNKSWALEFLDRYKKEIGLPFLVNLRPEQIYSEMIASLTEAGCYCVQMGLESAVSRLRQEVLGRNISDKAMEDAARRIKDAGIRLLAYNIVGLPDEKLQDAKATIEWNARMQVDFPRISIFQPYPRTTLGEKVLGKMKDEQIEKDNIKKRKSPDNNISDHLSVSYFRRSPFKDKETRHIENLQKLFYLYIKIPWLRKVIMGLIRLPRNPVFDMIFLFSMALQYRRSTNRTFTELVNVGFRNLRAYFN